MFDINRKDKKNELQFATTKQFDAILALVCVDNYPLDSAIGFVMTSLLDSDLSG